jgi:hypothetical protein
MGSGVKDYINGRDTFIIYAPSMSYFKRYIKFRYFSKAGTLTIFRHQSPHFWEIHIYFILILLIEGCRPQFLNTAISSDRLY